MTVWIADKRDYDQRLLADDFESASNFIYDTTGIVLEYSDVGEVVEEDIEGQISFDIDEITDWWTAYVARSSK